MSFSACSISSDRESIKRVLQFSMFWCALKDSLEYTVLGSLHNRFPNVPTVTHVGQQVDFFLIIGWENLPATIKLLPTYHGACWRNIMRVPVDVLQWPPRRKRTTF
ncbi:hypothetical protein K1T71_000082 [Dendrolimus kikuchii]|uniref:Uncharacterized protein n=1 Tax=Dendrolimus kikuchii TaxID=765133 RepID=A0ACC1DI69_9NEOP|nr:hypothetical protein K1T71_000082 [Dendrolimus kikuchii]